MGRQALNKLGIATYEFPKAAITKYHKLACLKQQKLNSLIVLETKDPRSRCWQDRFLLREMLFHGSHLTSGDSC